MKKFEIPTYATAGETACRMLHKDLQGEVIGVFSQGIYCRIGEDILLFHDAKWEVVPFGIALPDFAAFAAEVNLSAGDRISLSGSEIAAGERLFAMQRIPTVSDRIAAVEAYVHANGSADGMVELIRENRGNVREKIDALTRGDDEAAVKLIGLGRGLTPSGDDFLCGFISLLSKAEHPLAKEVREAIAANLHRTTDISAAYVKSALSGEYFTVYDRAVRAILGDEPFELNCDFVLAMGASSGTDTMLGVLAAAKLL